MRFSSVVLAVALGVSQMAVAATPDPFQGDPFKSHQWVPMRDEFLGGDVTVVFDERVRVTGPGFAEDAMNVPVSVDASALGDVQRVVVMVDRNPIRKVLEFEPKLAKAALSFRFKLEQGSAVRAAALDREGVWHVGGTWVDADGGGCTVPGETRLDGSWDQTLGQVSSRFFSSSRGGARLKARIMHPMDTGLVAGIPAFYIKQLSLAANNGDEYMRLRLYEPVSENPLLSFDFDQPPVEALTLTGIDNNGNRIRAEVVQ